MAANRHLHRHTNTWSLLAGGLSAILAAMAIWQPAAPLRLTDLAAAGLFWWGAIAAERTTVHSTAHDQ